MQAQLDKISAKLDVIAADVKEMSENVSPPPPLSPSISLSPTLPPLHTQTHTLSFSHTHTLSLTCVVAADVKEMSEKVRPDPTP